MAERFIDLEGLLEADAGVVEGTLVDAGMQRQFSRRYEFTKSGDSLNLKPLRGRDRATLPAKIPLTRELVAFLGMSLTVVPVVLGDAPKDRERTRYKDTGLLVGPPLMLLIILGVLGLWLPEPLRALVTEAAGLLEGFR